MFVPQIQLELYKMGSRVGYTTYNASGLDKMGLMNISQLVNSSWGDIHSSGRNNTVIASLEGISRYCLNTLIGMRSYSTGMIRNLYTLNEL